MTPLPARGQDVSRESASRASGESPIPPRTTTKTTTHTATKIVVASIVGVLLFGAGLFVAARFFAVGPLLQWFPIANLNGGVTPTASYNDSFINLDNIIAKDIHTTWNVGSGSLFFTYTDPPTPDVSDPDVHYCFPETYNADRVVGKTDSADVLPAGKVITQATARLYSPNYEKGYFQFCLSNNNGVDWKRYQGDVRDTNARTVPFDTSGKRLTWEVNMVYSPETSTKGQSLGFLPWKMFLSPVAYASSDTAAAFDKIEITYQYENGITFSYDGNIGFSNINNGGNANTNINAANINVSNQPNGNLNANTNTGDVPGGDTGTPGGVNAQTVDANANENGSGELSPVPVESDIGIAYRGFHRVILSWSNSANILYWGESADALVNQATVHEASDGSHYVVLTGLKGGEIDERDGDGFTRGRFPYFFQIRTTGSPADDPEGNTNIATDTHSSALTFKTLNRRQAILYAFNLVLGESYDIQQEYTDSEYEALRNGGPEYYYLANEKTLSLPGITHTLINDRQYKEFDTIINNFAEQDGKEAAIRWMYRAILDRIYEDDLSKVGDEKGIEFWTTQVTQPYPKRIDLAGVKFALSTSPEFRETLTSQFTDEKQAQAEWAYQTVLKRGGEGAGLQYLAVHFTTEKEMRRYLIQGDEYASRIADISKNFGIDSAIAEMYQTILGRASDILGITYYKTFFGGNLSNIKKHLLDSEEYTAVAPL